MWLFACGSNAPERVRSVPSDPVAQLGGEALLEPVVVLTELKALFPSGVIAPPGGLAELRPGQEAAAARAVLDAAHAPGTPMTSLEQGGRWIVQAKLAASERVGVTLILDPEGAALEQIDLALSETEALLVLQERWGDPEPGPPLRGGRRFHRWSGPIWDAELYALEGGQGVLKFLATDASGPSDAPREPSGR